MALKGAGCQAGALSLDTDTEGANRAKRVQSLFV